MSTAETITIEELLRHAPGFSYPKLELLRQALVEVVSPHRDTDRISEAEWAEARALTLSLEVARLAQQIERENERVSRSIEEVRSVMGAMKKGR